jgi:drug/metabolite transporter (DMT)-like permease
MDIRTRASIALVLGGALWGAIWIPLRALEAAGLGGAWAGLVIYAGAALAMGLGLILSRRPLRGLGLPLVLSGLATGAAFSLYSSSLAMTEVVRAILLFYLTPVWGTLLGIAFLGERLTTPRLAALVLALIGLVVVLGGDGFPRPRSAGDWLALASGFSWALGALLVYRAEEAGPVEQVSAFIFGSLAVTSGTMILAPSLFATGTSLGEAFRLLPWGVLMALWVVPMLFLTIWPASLLTPGRVGILLMSDVIVAVITAAWFSGEPFGLREAAGTILIVSAAAVEVLDRAADTDT